MKYKIHFLTVCFLMVTLVVVSQDLVQWRGINRDGIYHEKGLLEKWPESGLNMLWQYDQLGDGYSSALVLKDKIITTGLVDSVGIMYAIDLKGKLLWKTVYAKEWIDPYPGCRSTPTFFKDKLYINSSFGQAVCLDANTGNIIWSIDLAEEFGAEPPKWGIVESPLIVDNKVIFTTGAKDSNIVALDVNDGKTIWTSPGKGQLTAYCSPIMFSHSDRKMMCTITANDILGIEVETGKVLWDYPYENKHSVHANTPVYSNGYLFVVSGYGLGGVKLKIAEDGNSVKKVWTNVELDNQMGGVVLLNSTIYGSGQNTRAWLAVDWETGEVKYKTKSLGKGVTIANDGLLYCYSDKGDLALVRARKTKFDIISKMKITLGTGEHWAHPVIHNKVLYLRHGNTLIAYSLTDD